MDLIIAILISVILVISYLALKEVLIKKHTPTKTRIYFVVIFDLLVLIGTTLALLNSKFSFMLLLFVAISILPVFISSISWLVYSYKKEKNGESFYDNKIKITYLKGYIRISLLAFLLFIILETLLVTLLATKLLVNNNLTIFVTVFCGFLCLIPLILISIVKYSTTKKHLKYESVIIYNDKSYLEFDVTNNTYYNLSKLINDKGYIIDLNLSSKIILNNLDNKNKFIRMYYLNNYNIINENFDQDYFTSLKKLIEANFLTLV